MRYLLILLFLGGSLVGMEEGSVKVISPAEFEAAKPWRDVFSHRNPDEILEGVQRLLQAGEDPNRIIPAKDLTKSLATTPLHVAAERGLLNVVTYLLVHGAALDGKDGNGSNVLSAALKRYKTQSFLKERVGFMPTPDLSVAKLFLLQGANPYEKNQFGVSQRDFIDPTDTELWEMLENFETYKSKHEEEFRDVQDQYDSQQVIKFSRRYSTVFNALRVREMGQRERVGFKPQVPLRQAVKRRRDAGDSDGEGLRSPKSRASSHLDAPFAPVKRKRGDRDDEDSDEEGFRSPRSRTIPVE